MIYLIKEKIFGYINDILIEEKESEFEKFDKNCFKIIDKKLPQKHLEKIKYKINLDEQAKEYLEMKFSGKIKKGKIDDLFNYVKEMKNNFVESDKIKL